MKCVLEKLLKIINMDGSDEVALKTSSKFFPISDMIHQYIALKKTLLLAKKNENVVL